MKTLLGPLVCLTVLAGLCACTPPEEEVHPRKRSSRSDNLKRYMPKAQELRALEQARSKPVAAEPLLVSDVLKDFLPKSADTRISEAVSAQRASLKEAVRAAHARRAAGKISALAAKLGAEASSAIESVQTPEEMAAVAADLSARYARAFTEAGEEEIARGWAAADVRQSRLSRRELHIVFQNLAAGIERDYGALCAQKAMPVLQKAADDYGLVLSSVKTENDLAGEFARVGSEADASFAAAAAQYGDPALMLSPENIASLKAQIISAHQEIERAFEKLYGKEAVLQTREIFERYLNAAEKLFAAPGRLSECTEKLDGLNGLYREEMTALQVKLNEDLEQKLLAAKNTGTL